MDAAVVAEVFVNGFCKRCVVAKFGLVNGEEELEVESGLYDREVCDAGFLTEAAVASSYFERTVGCWSGNGDLVFDVAA